MRIVAREPEAVRAIVAALPPSLARSLPMVAAPAKAAHRPPALTGPEERAHLARSLAAMPNALRAAIVSGCKGDDVLMHQIVSASICPAACAIRQQVIVEFFERNRRTYSMRALADWLHVHRSTVYKIYRRARP